MTRAWQDTAVEDSPTRDLLFTGAAALLALLPRLFVAIAWAREPVWDGHYYHFGAQRIADGLGYSEHVRVGAELVWRPWSHYPVGYSAFLAIFYKLAGLPAQLFGERFAIPAILIAPLVNALVGTALVVVLHRVARFYLNEDRSRVAAGLCALHPGLIAYTVVVMTEQLAALLVLAALWAALHWRGRWLGVALGGVTLGLATLVRPSCVLAAPLLIFTQAAPWWSALLRASIAAAVAVVTVVPWTIRNCKVMDACTFVSTNGGWNLAIGALTDTGRFVTLRAADGCPVVTGQVQQDRCWGKVGRDAIRRDPARWLGLMPKKLAQTFNHESFAIEYLREADPQAWPERRRVAGRELLTLFHRLLLGAAGLGVAARIGRRSRPLEIAAQLGVLAVLLGLFAYGSLNDWHPFHWLVVAIPLLGLLPLPGRPWQGPVGLFALSWLAVTAAIHAVFFGDDRYHLVVTPLLCLLAAAALRAPLTRRAASYAASVRA